MQINRKLTIGMFILGAMSHYDKEEVIKYPSVQYIAATLVKKHFEIRNGTTQERMWIKPRYIANQIHKAPKKADEFHKKGETAMKSILRKQNEWVTQAKIADTAWIRAADSFGADNAITVSALILAILRKEPEMAKWYGFNKKKMDKFAQSSEFKNMHIFASSRVATTLIKCLDQEIAHYNYEQSKS